MKIPNKKNCYALLFLFLSVFTFFANPLYAAFRQEVDRALLKKAENYYYEGDFDNAVKITNQFISQSKLSIADRKDAYILLVHIYLARSEATSARKVVENILDIDPAYAPTLEQETPKYVTFVTEIKKQYMQRKARSGNQEINWLLWGGAGAAGALLLVILLAGGDNDKNDSPPDVLSRPPAFPED